MEDQQEGKPATLMKSHFILFFFTQYWRDIKTKLLFPEVIVVNGDAHIFKDAIITKFQERELDDRNKFQPDRVLLVLQYSDKNGAGESEMLF